MPWRVSVTVPFIRDEPVGTDGLDGTALNSNTAAASVLVVPVVFAAPVFTPAKRLFVPAVLKIRLPPRLNCVAASKMFAVPVPPLLKFVQDASSLRELRHKRFAPLVPRLVTTTVLVGVSANAGDPKNTPLVPPL